MRFPFGDWFGARRTIQRVRLPGSDTPTYRAVGIRPGKDCCQGAVQLSGVRYLVGKAPSLPLPGCEAPSCDCRYNHYSDRRRGAERRRAVASATAGVVPFDRRQSNGRRATDAPF